MNLKTGGFQRSYRLHVPSGYNGTTKMPMVVVVHGAFDTARGMERFSDFSRLADSEGFIVLYPEGVGILGYLQHWNGSAVILCQIEGWGHVWPGPYFAAGLSADDALFNFDAAKVIWDFFQRFP